MLAERVVEWTEEWKRQGLEQGMQAGEARILLRQLRHRFGDLPGDVVRRIESADAETLLTWSERVLTAATIDDLFR